MSRIENEKMSKKKAAKVEMGSKMKMARLAKGLSVKTVVYKAYLGSTQTLYNYECGKSTPTWDTLVILAWIYNCSLDDFVA